MKKFFRVFFLTMILCLITALSVSAKGDVKKITKTVNPTEGAGKPITIITANKFLYEEGMVLFEFESEDPEFLNDAFCVMTTGDVEEAGGKWIQNENGTYFARCYTDDDMDCGKQTINLKISKNEENSEVVYRTSIEVEICEEFAPIAEMDGLTINEKQTLTKYDSNMNISVYSLNKVHPSKIKLADKSGNVYMATDNADSVYCNSTGYIKNIYYTDVFKEEALDCLDGIDGYYIGGYMQLAKPLKVGVYDLIVYNEDETASAKLENVATVIDKPAIDFRSNGSNYLAEQKAGDEMFWISAEVQGASPTTINKINMYDDKGNLFAQSTGKYIVENYYYHDRNTVFEMKPLSGSFKYGTYSVEVDSETDFYCSSDRLYMSENTSSNVYMNRILWGDPEVANFVVELSNANPTSQYKFELYDKKNSFLSEEYVNVSEDGIADLEFKDSEGEIIKITPRDRYNVYFYSKTDGEWKQQRQYGFSTYYDYNPSSTAQGLTAYVNVYNGSVEGSLTMPQSMKGSYSSDKFVIKVRSIGGEEKTYTPTVNRRTLSNGNYYIELKVLNANLPDGCYTAALYYNSNEIVPYEERYSFSMTTPDAGGYSDNINRTRYIRRIYFDYLDTVTNPTLKLYNVFDGDFEPEHIISLVKNGDQYYIPETVKFDKNLAYYYEIIANGETYSAEFNDGEYFSNQQYDASKSCTVTVKQTANGTTSVSNTNPKVGDTVYVTAKADEGYQYTPVSVKVNGVRIKGRSFVIFEDATVEVEYREIPVAMYKATAQNYSSSSGEVTVDKEYYKPGETVKVSVNIFDNNYKVDRLRYRKSGEYNWTDIDLTTKTFVMPEYDIIIEAGYMRKSTRSIYKQNYSDFSIYTYNEGSTTSYVMEGEPVTVTAYLNSTRKELPASEFEELYYVLSSDTTGKKNVIYNGRFTMPSENITIYGALRKRPLSAEVTGKGSVKFKKAYSGEVTEAYATEQITVEGTGIGSFRLTSIEVNGVSQTNTTFEMPTGNLKLKANFTSDKFVKVKILDTENGTVSVDTADWEYEDGLDYYYNRKLLVKFKPYTGYKLKSLLINDDDYVDWLEEGEQQFSYEIERGNSEVTIKAEFEQTHYEAIYVDDNNQIITKQYYELGTEGVYNGFTPYRAPNEKYAYIFKGWDKESVTGPDVVKAIFEPVEYTKISTEADLKAMGSTGYYVLTNDITLTESWTPIAEFSGTLDGCGHVIKNLNSDIVGDSTYSWKYHTGFFINLKGTVINTGFELAHEKLDVTEELYIGGIASIMNGARVENCYVSGTMKYNTMTCCGPIAYNADNSVIRNCYTNVDAQFTDGDEGNFGGLAEWVDNTSEVYTSYSNSRYISDTTGLENVFKIGIIENYAVIENVYYNKDRYTGYDTEWEPITATTEKLKTLSYFYNGIDHNLDFVKIWGLDSEVNGGLPFLKIFGTNPIKTTSTATMLETGTLKAEVKFSQPVAGEMFTLVRSGNKSSFKQIKGDDIVQNLDLSIDAKKEPDEVKVIVWENFANIKPVVMETLEIK